MSGIWAADTFGVGDLIALSAVQAGTRGDELFNELPRLVGTSWARGTRVQMFSLSTSWAGQTLAWLLHGWEEQELGYATFPNRLDYNADYIVFEDSDEGPCRVTTLGLLSASAAFSTRSWLVGGPASERLLGIECGTVPPGTEYFTAVGLWEHAD